MSHFLGYQGFLQDANMASVVSEEGGGDDHQQLESLHVTAVSIQMPTLRKATFPLEIESVTSLPLLPLCMSIREVM